MPWVIEAYDDSPVKIVDGRPLCGSCEMGKHSHSAPEVYTDGRDSCKNTSAIEIDGKRQLVQCVCGNGFIWKDGAWFEQKEAYMGWVLEAADKSELEMGIEVEKEHTDTIKWLIKKMGSGGPATPIDEIIAEATKRIAQDHLKEMSDYYTKLKKMEGHGQS